MTETAVVILNYNGKEWLRKFLPLVIKYSPNAEIIVADNKSTDNSISFLQNEFQAVRLIPIPENRGYSGGYNYALKEVEATYLVLLNTDVEVTEGWLDPVLALFRNDPTVGAAQPKILSCAHRDEFEYAGAAGGFIDAFGYPFCRGRIFDHLEKDHGQYDDIHEIFWASGACFFVRKDVFMNHNGFDEDFFAHMEEIDFCWRLQRSGLKVLYQGNSRVFHVGGGTLSKSNPRKTYLNFKNGLSMLIKNLKWSDLLLVFPIRIVLDWIAALRFLSLGQAKDFWAVFRSHFNIFFRVFSQLTKRTPPFFSKRRIKTIYPRSIVYDFYVSGKKEFKEIWD